MDQFTEAKVIQSLIVQVQKARCSGLAVVQKFQGQIRKTYLVHLHRKDREHFTTAEGRVGPLEAIFRQLDFKPLVFGTFAEISRNVKDFIETAVEYGVDHLGRTMAEPIVYAVRMSLRS